MSNINTSGGGTTPIFTNSIHEKPKDIFTALSQIEIFAASEELGSKMPEMYATTKERTEYFTLGMRSMIGHAYVSISLAPISTAVINNKLPIFGSFEPDFAEKSMAYILSFGMSLMYMLIYVHVAKIRMGTISKILSNNLLTGMTIGAIFKLIIAATIYGVLYFMVLTPNNMYMFFGMLGKFGVTGKYFELARYLIGTLKSSLIPAIYIYFYTTIGVILAPWLVVIFKSITNKKEEL